MRRHRRHHLEQMGAGEHTGSTSAASNHLSPILRLPRAQVMLIVTQLSSSGRSWFDGVVLYAGNFNGSGKRDLGHPLGYSCCLYMLFWMASMNYSAVTVVTMQPAVVPGPGLS